MIKVLGSKVLGSEVLGSKAPLAAGAASAIGMKTFSESEKVVQIFCGIPWERLPAAIDSIWRIPESWLEATPTIP
jgi:hypothetical protein